MKPVRYSEQEDLIILECIGKYPLNIQEGLKTAAAEILKKVSVKRSHASVGVRYYNVLSKKTHTITAGSAVGMSMNKKVAHRKDGIMPDQKLKPTLAVISQMMKLSEEDRAIIVKLFK